MDGGDAGMVISVAVAVLGIVAVVLEVVGVVMEKGCILGGFWIFYLDRYLN